MKREWQIKHVSRTEKLRLIEWEDIDMIMIKKFGYFPIMFEIETIPSTCEPQISKMIPPTTNDSIKLRCSTENLSRMNQPESNLNLQNMVLTYGSISSAANKLHNCSVKMLGDRHYKTGVDIGLLSVKYSIKIYWLFTLSVI